MGEQVYSKAKPHLDLIYQATVEAGLPDETISNGFAELVRQQVALENNYTDVSIIRPLAKTMKGLLDGFYLLSKKELRPDSPATFYDLYAAAAGAYHAGMEPVARAIQLAGWDYNQWKGNLDGETAKYIGPTTGSRKSVLWDTNPDAMNAWFAANYTPPELKGSLMWLLYALLGLGGAYGLYRLLKNK